MPNPTPTHRIMAVTPAIARQWLTHNVHNRPISNMTVTRYRSDMMTGRWSFAGDPIRFDTLGNLIDGQHRLHALAACPDDLAINFMVIMKLPTDTQAVMDQGRRRTPGDQLGLAGIKDANAVAAGVRLYLAHAGGLLFRDTKVAAQELTTVQIQEWVGTHMDLVEQVLSVPHHRMSHCPPSVSICAAMLFIEHSGMDLACAFFRLLNVGTAEGNPINALDRRLRRIKDGRVKTSPREFLALFIQAMNAWLDNKSMTKFQMPRGAHWTAENFPRLRGVA